MAENNHKPKRTMFWGLLGFELCSDFVLFGSFGFLDVLGFWVNPD